MQPAIEAPPQQTPFGLPLGLHYGIPSERYHTPVIGVISKGALDAVNRSPLHYLEWLAGNRKDTKALRFGRMLHSAALEPELFTSSYVVQPDFGDCRKPANRAAKDSWLEAHADRDVVEAEDLDAAKCMVRALKAHPLASRILRDGKPEVTVTWQDSATGLYGRTRTDYYVESLSMAVDLKSTEDASEKEFQRSVAKWRYHVTDALYRFAFAAADKPVEHYVFVAVEKSPPYAVAIYSLDAESVGRGYTAARQNIDVLADCMRTNDWRGYSEHITEIELPRWA